MCRRLAFSWPLVTAHLRRGALSRNWFAQEPQLAALIAVGDAASTTVASNNWTRALGMLLTNSATRPPPPCVPVHAASHCVPAYASDVELKRHVLQEYPSVLSKLVQLLDGAGVS